MACQLLKASCASYAKGLRSLQRSTGPFAYRLLWLLWPVMAINKPDFLAGGVIFLRTARYGGDFLAAIENNRDFTLSQQLFVSIVRNRKILSLRSICCGENKINY